MQYEDWIFFTTAVPYSKTRPYDRKAKVKMRRCKNDGKWGGGRGHKSTMDVIEEYLVEDCISL